MQDLYEAFLKHLENEDKEQCVRIVLKALDEAHINVPDLYSRILTPALNRIGSEPDGREVRIWEEHVQSSIVRTLIECCYPYVLKERDRKGEGAAKGKAVILCPDGEAHELGARMAADFFTLAGYDVLFVGGNTPKEEFLDVIHILRPQIAAISVSNYFNLVAAKRTITGIREKCSDAVKIVVGGRAFDHNTTAYTDIGADERVETLEDILKLEAGGG